MKETIIQLTSGNGPVECCWVVAKVQKILLKEAKELQINHVILQREKGEGNGTLKSVVIKLIGDHLDNFLAGWLGTVQWIGRSQFRKHQKRKNWFIGINVLPMSNPKFQINLHQVRFEFTKSNGPGGQHVNKVNTAVWAKHLPSGESVKVSAERSQWRNKQLALEKLASRLEKKSLEACKEQLKEGRENHMTLQRGNPVRIFKGNDFKSNYLPKKYRHSRKRERLKVIKALDY